MASPVEEATNPLYDVDDDGDVVEDDEEEDEDEVEAKILQLQDQFQEVKQQRKEARLIPRPDSPTSAKERARSAERSRYLQRSTQETRDDEGKSRYEFAPRPQSASAAMDRMNQSSGSGGGGGGGGHGHHAGGASSGGVTVATVKEEPTTFMRDVGLVSGGGGGGGGDDGSAGGIGAGVGGIGAGVGGIGGREDISGGGGGGGGGGVSAREVDDGVNPGTTSRIEEEEEDGEEEVEVDEWATAEEERMRRREDLQRRRKALEDRIPTQPKPEKPPPPPKTRMETGLDFLRRDISHVVAKAAVVVPRGDAGGDGTMVLREGGGGNGGGNVGGGGGGGSGGGGGGGGRGIGGGGGGDGSVSTLAPAAKAELAHARRVNRLAMREGILGLRRTGAALQPTSGIPGGGTTSSAGFLHQTMTNARHARAAAAPAAAASSAAGKPRPRTAGWQPTGKASAAERARERERERTAAAAAAPSFAAIDSNWPPPASSSGGGGAASATWRPVGEKSSVLAEARYVPLNATPLGYAVAPRGEAGEGRNLDNPVEVAKARVALHESKRALGLPEPCDFEEATLMGLHVRLKEANACARQLGLGTRYRTVPAGPRSIRIEVYYPDEGCSGGGGGGGGGASGDEEDGTVNAQRRRRMRKKKRFVSVDAFMKSESRLLLQASHGVGGNVYRAMKEENQRRSKNRPLSAAAAGQVKQPSARGSGKPRQRLIAAAGGDVESVANAAVAKTPSWR